MSIRFCWVPGSFSLAVRNTVDGLSELGKFSSGRFGDMMGICACTDAVKFAKHFRKFRNIFAT